MRGGGTQGDTFGAQPPPMRYGITRVQKRHPGHPEETKRGHNGEDWDRILRLGGISQAPRGVQMQVGKSVGWVVSGIYSFLLESHDTTTDRRGNRIHFKSENRIPQLWGLGSRKD